jgi:hypothetical protein
MEATSAPWFSPLCSHCGKPIERVTEALAGWRYDEGGETYAPVIVHCDKKDGACDFFRGKKQPPGYHDDGVVAFRECPAEAVELAMKRMRMKRNEVKAWANWLGVIFGLPGAKPSRISRA